MLYKFLTIFNYISFFFFSFFIIIKIFFFPWYFLTTKNINNILNTYIYIYTYDKKNLSFFFFCYICNWSSRNMLVSLNQLGVWAQHKRDKQVPAFKATADHHANKFNSLTAMINQHFENSNFFLINSSVRKFSFIPIWVVELSVR